MFIGGQGGMELNPRRQLFRAGVNGYLQQHNEVLGGCVSALEVAGDSLILGWDLGPGRHLLRAGVASTTILGDPQNRHLTFDS
jgi:hypothetical protein